MSATYLKLIYNRKGNHYEQIYKMVRQILCSTRSLSDRTRTHCSPLCGGRTGTSSVRLNRHCYHTHRHHSYAVWLQCNIQLKKKGEREMIDMLITLAYVLGIIIFGILLLAGCAICFFIPVMLGELFSWWWCLLCIVTLPLGAKLLSIINDFLDEHLCFDIF